MAVRIRQLLREKLLGVHSTPTKRQVELQRVYTGLGAEFGQSITDANITFAVKREPVAHRIVFAVAHDIFDNWFEAEPLEEGVECIRPYVSYATLRRMRASFWASLRPFWLTQTLFF